jgi:hypothetical protein
MTAFIGTTYEKVFDILTLLMSLIGCAASIITIILIRRMKTASGYPSHLLLVLIMSYYQVGYDFTFFFRSVYTRYYVFVVAFFFQVLFGIAGSLISNWISFVALYIVVMKRKLDANQYFWKILWTSTLPALIIALLFFAAAVPQTHRNEHVYHVTEYLNYYVRLVLIGINFLFCGAILYQVELISSQTTKKSPQELAIRLLARRMIFYPIVQAIGRLGFAWYEQVYGFSIDNPHPTKTQFASMLVISIITPLVSVGYLIIFLTMQPDAYQQFKRLIRCKTISAKPTRIRSSSHIRKGSSETSSKQTLRQTFQSFIQSGGEQPPIQDNLDRVESNESLAFDPNMGDDELMQTLDLHASNDGTKSERTSFFWTTANHILPRLSSTVSAPPGTTTTQIPQSPSSLSSASSSQPKQRLSQINNNNNKNNINDIDFTIENPINHMSVDDL